MRRITPLLTLAVLLGGLLATHAVANGHETDAAAGSPGDTNEEVVRRFIEESWEQGDLALLDELVSPAAAGSVAGLPPQAPGPEGYKQLVAGFRLAFPDLDYEIHSLIAAGDNVVVEWTLRGTFTGDLQGLPPTGEPIEVAGISIFWMEDGQVVDNHSVFDTLTFAQQTGAVPAPAAASEGSRSERPDIGPRDVTA